MNSEDLAQQLHALSVRAAELGALAAESPIQHPARLIEGLAQLQARLETLAVPGQGLSATADRQRPAESQSDDLAWREAIFEGSRDAIFISDADSRFTFVNSAACQLTGYSKQDLLTMRDPDLRADADLDPYRMYHDRIIAGEEIQSEAKIKRKDGSKADTEFNDRRIVIEGVPYIYTTACDVTERKRAQEALRESEERYHLLVENARAAIVVAQDGVLKFFNPAGLKIIGYSQEELSNQPFSKLIHPDDREEVIGYYTSFLKGAGTSPILTLRIIDNEGRTKWVEGNATLITWEGRPATLNFLTDITDRRRAEGALRESQMRLQALFDNAQDAFLLADDQARYVDVNPAVSVLLGYSREELLQLSVWDITPDPNREIGLRLWQEFIAAGHQQGEYTLRQKDGGIVETEYRAVANIGPGLHLSILRDITERKRAEEAQRESELQFRTLIEQAPVAISVSRDGLGLYANQKFLHIIGLQSVEESIGRPIFEYFAPQYREESKERSRRRSLGLPVASEFESVFVRTDGSQFPIQASVAQVKLSDGMANVAFVSDITERKRAEQALRESEAKFRAVVENSYDGILFGDAKANILYRSPSFFRINGYTDEERVGHSRFETTHPDELENVRRWWAKVLEHPEMSHMTEYRIRHKDGTWRWIESSGHNLLSNPDLHSVVVTCRDITERKHAEHAEREQRLFADALRDSAGALNSTLDLDEVLDCVLENAERVVPHTTSNIMLLEADNVRVVRSRGYAERGLKDWIDGLKLPIEQFSSTHSAIETGLYAFVQDTRTFPGWTTLQQTQWIRSHLSAPIRMKGNVIGILNLDSDNPGSFTATDADRIQAFADQAATAIENARLFQEVKRSAEGFRVLYEITHDLATNRDLPTLLQAVVERAVTLLGAGSASIMLFDPVRQDLEIAVTSGPEFPPGARYQLGEGIAGRVALTREPMIVSDCRTWEGRSPQFNDIPFAACVEVPLLYQGLLIGVLAVNELGTSTRKFIRSDADLLSLFAAPAAAAVNSARLFEEINMGRERLHKLSSQLVALGEKERRSLANELHDEIGQTLTGLRLTLEGIRRLPPEQAEANLTRAQTMINEMIGQVRDLALQLRPAILDDLGLLPALVWYLDRFTVQTNVRVIFKHQGLEGNRFEYEIETAAFRIVQEALTNVARHAQVAEVAVRVWTDADTLNVQVADQGIGFDPEAVLASNQTSGVSGMRERAALLGGRFTIESTLGQGSFLTAELPVGGRLERRTKPR